MTLHGLGMSNIPVKLWGSGTVTKPCAGTKVHGAEDLVYSFLPKNMGMDGLIQQLWAESGMHQKVHPGGEPLWGWSWSQGADRRTPSLEWLHLC